MASKQEISEYWQLQCSQIRDRASHILKMEQWTDCSFLVGPDAEQVEVKAHKLILVMASPVFEAMFYGPIAEKDGPITIPDMQPEAFKALLEYMYTDNIQISSNKLAMNVYYGAQKYMLTNLQAMCIEYLSKNLTSDMVCCVYEFALMVDEKDLVMSCEDLIQAQTTDVLNGSSFLEAQLDTVVRIYSMNCLNIGNELALVRAANMYNMSRKGAQTAKMFKDAVESKTFNYKFTSPVAKKKVHQNIVDTTPEKNDPAMETFEVLHKPLAEVDEVKEENTVHKNEEPSGREILKVLKQINFLSLSTQQLAEEKCLASLLTADELMAVIMNVASFKTYIPLPHGFSTNRTGRKHYNSDNKQLRILQSQVTGPRRSKVIALQKLRANAEKKSLQNLRANAEKNTLAIPGRSILKSCKKTATRATSQKAIKIDLFHDSNATESDAQDTNSEDPYETINKDRNVKEMEKETVPQTNSRTSSMDAENSDVPIIMINELIKSPIQRLTHQDAITLNSPKTTDANPPTPENDENTQIVVKPPSRSIRKTVNIKTTNKKNKLSVQQKLEEELRIAQSQVTGPRRSKVIALQKLRANAEKKALQKLRANAEKNEF